MMEEEFKRWTAKRKAALITEITQCKASIAEASRPSPMRSRTVLFMAHTGLSCEENRCVRQEGIQSRHEAPMYLLLFPVGVGRGCVSAALA